jgi:hypothetical protein
MRLRYTAHELEALARPEVDQRRVLACVRRLPPFAHAAAGLRRGVERLLVQETDRRRPT